MAANKVSCRAWLRVHRYSQSKPIGGQFPVIEAAVRGPTPEGIHVPSATRPQS
jgi:hypothetical protein